MERVEGEREQMLAVGMAYLQFSSQHADYFNVIFNAGLDKAKYPEFARIARQSFDIIWLLSHQFESDSELGDQRAVASWALVHGLPTLSMDGSLSTATTGGRNFEHLQSILR